MTDKTVTLGIDGSNHSYPLLEGSVGPEVIDIRKLYNETGMFTYDPGFTSTASCMAVISARSCSVSRSPALRKKSARTVAKRSRPAPRAGASEGSAGADPIGHSSAIIAEALSDFG